MSKKKASDKITREAVRDGEDTIAQMSEKTDLNAAARKVASQYRDNTISPNVVAGFLRCTDLFVTFAAGMLAYIYYIGFFERMVVEYTSVAVIGAFLIFLGFYVCHFILDCVL